MSVRIPLEPSVPFYTISTTLAGSNYRLDVRWNTRRAAWFFDVLTEDGELLAANLGIFVNAFPLLKHHDPRLPVGSFIIRDLAGTETDATFDDIGVRVVLEFWDVNDWSEFL